MIRPKAERWYREAKAGSAGQLLAVVGAIRGAAMLAVPAVADSEFPQFDLEPHASSVTGTVRRDSIAGTIG